MYISDNAGIPARGARFAAHSAVLHRSETRNHPVVFAVRTVGELIFGAMNAMGALG